MTTSHEKEKNLAIEPKQGKENQVAQETSEEKLCFECKRPLAESPQLINIAGQTHKWHPECFKCNICHEPMDKNVSCHIYKDKILCRNDYIQLQRDNLVECARCRWPVGPSDWVRKAGKYVYHIACFNCDVCSRQLNTGEQFTIRIQERDNVVRLLCRLHFTIEKQPNHNQPQQQADSGATSTSSSANLQMIGRDDESSRNHQLQSMIFRSRFRSPSISSRDIEQQQHHDPYNQRSFKSTQRSSKSSSLCHASTSGNIVDYKLASQSLNNKQASQTPPTFHVSSSPSSSESSSSPASNSPSSSPATSSALSSPNGSNSLMGTHSLHGCSGMSQSKSKRVRTTFTEDQLSILQNHFQIDSNPDGQDLERIATITGLSKRVTQVWFQNSRARQKKYMIKRKPGSNPVSTNLIATAASITTLPSMAPPPTATTIKNTSENLRTDFDMRQICSAVTDENNMDVGADLISYSLTNWSNRNKSNNLNTNLKQTLEHVIHDDDSRANVAATDKQLFVIEGTTNDHNDDDDDADDDGVAND